MEKGFTEGVFQVGVLVSDVDECLRLFCGALGMKVVFDVRNQIQPASELSGNDHQVMNVLMLHGKDGVDLEIHQYVEPKAKAAPPMNHNEIGSIHFMLRVDDIHAVVEKIEALGYKLMSQMCIRDRCISAKGSVGEHLRQEDLQRRSDRHRSRTS